jgi:hypothetical protein
MSRSLSSGVASVGKNKFENLTKRLRWKEDVTTVADDVRIVVRSKELLPEIPLLVH